MSGEASSGLAGIVADAERLLIKQVKEWGEILVGFETRNRYDVRDEDGAVVAYAAEEGGGFGKVVARNFLGRCRACKIHVYAPDGTPLGRGEKPFRWFFHRMEVWDGDRKIGAMQRRWSLFHRLFTVENAEGREVLSVKSPWFRIWTFKLLYQDKEVGRISKRWAGVLKEMFSDADMFGVEFGTSKLPVDIKSLLLVGTFLVDFTCFENNQRRGGGLGFLGD